MFSQQPDKEPLISTACWIAAVRARESERADRLFHDPWAARLAGEEGWAWRQRLTGGKDENEVGLAIRTRFFDDFLLHVTREYAVPQVVLAAAVFCFECERVQSKRATGRKVRTVKTRAVLGKLRNGERSGKSR